MSSYLSLLDYCTINPQVELRLGLNDWVSKATLSERPKRQIAYAKIRECLDLKITMLDLSGLGLTSLPNEISALSKLQKLNASHNNLESFPDLSECKKLVSIDVSHNELTGFPDLTRFYDLELLDLSYNKIEKVPDCPDSSSLKCLNLVHNQVVYLSENFAHLSSECEISIDNNPISIKTLENFLQLIKEPRGPKILCSVILIKEIFRREIHAR